LAAWFHNNLHHSANRKARYLRTDLRHAIFLSTVWSDRAGANMKFEACKAILFFAVALYFAVSSAAQSQSSPASQQAKVVANYPKDKAGVMIQIVDWVTLPSAAPTKTRAKHGIAASMSYGAVPANVVSEYEGLHAAIQIPSGQPIICLCHLISLPGAPVIVRLHPKKESRELDGGRMRVLPIVGGSKIADANQSDLLPIDVTQPENMVWLVHPQQPLPVGEYALMLGTQNVSIFPFTVTQP
jgi:hypothetical protein